MTGLTLPTLIQDGMFMDAMLYTSVSHNLSLGFGTFWFPQFSLHNVAGLSSFHEQPPLVFGIQAIFFKILGDSMYVERFYTFLTMCINAFFFHLLWREIFKNNSLKVYSWFAILLWITIPVCFWSFSNNMHENTMSIFTLAAVLFAYKSFDSQKFKFIFWVISGLFIVFATMSKGLPGFFPIVVPALYWLITRRISFIQTVMATIVISAIPALTYFVLFMIPASSESLSIYLFDRALHRINEVPTVINRFYILERLLMELLPQIGIVIILLIIGKVKKLYVPDSLLVRRAVFFMAIGLSASAPLMLTLVQKGFYFVPSLPFFAIGLAILGVPVLDYLISNINVHKIHFKIFLITCTLLFVGALSFSLMQKGKVSRDKVLLHDLYIIGEKVPERSVVSIPPELWGRFDIQCYLMRYFVISVEPGFEREYGLINETYLSAQPEDYKRVDLPTKEYHLFRRER